MYVDGLSDDMFNAISKYETGKNFKYSMSDKDTNGYDLGDAKGHKTFGYGLLYHPETGNYMDSTKLAYSQTELEDLYCQSASKRVDKVKSWASKKNISLNQNQVDSLVCACYNFGNGFLNKNICKTIAKNPNDFQTIVNEWSHLSDKQGVKYPGLIKRRKFEAEWYAQGSGVSVTDTTDTTSSTTNNTTTNQTQNSDSLIPNVFTSANSNQYQSVYSNDSSIADGSTNDTHTRIYQYTASTIPLDEMSLPLYDNINNNSEIDNSTGLHNDAIPNANNNPYKTSGNNSPSKSQTVGVCYPLLRINDHYFTDEDIVEFTLACEGFLPTIEVYIETSFNDLIKDNTIKDGDICSVFLNPAHDAIKSYRGDYQITMVQMDDQPAVQYYDKLKIHFIGELFIPSLYNGSLTFSFAGTSRDALIDIANKLGLGFFFCDPENTEDSQMWYSMSDGDQKEYSDPPAMQYIKYVASHAYKNFDSFFDCWIDPRYAISFINVAQILGNTGLDEELDMAVYNTALAVSRSVDGENMEASAEEKKSKASPQLKLLNNFNDANSTLTAFYVLNYKEETNGTISQQLGLSNNNYYSVQNSGVTSADEGSIEMQYSIPVNSDKLKHGYYILAGPGKNLTYTQADTGSFPDQHKTVQGGQISDTQSDDDGQSILQNGNNTYASGNTNKFYETGEGHNKLNNEWLKKKVIKVTVNGLNMQVMRGEKIPMMIVDTQNPAVNNMGIKDENDAVYKKIVSNCTGWFMIKSLRWIFKRYDATHGTPWTTKMTLTRREWPIPGFVKNGGAESEAAIVVENNVITGTTNNSKNDSSTSTDNSSISSSSEASSTVEKSDSFTTNGLKDFMVTIYNDVVSACQAQNKSIILTGARRWAADADGNKIEGNPIIQDGNKWKFINSKGDIVWFEGKTSAHFYGEAIDFVNASGSSFNEIGEIIATDKKTLVDMLTNGCYMAIENTADGAGTKVKHYHIGTTNSADSNSSLIRANWWNSIISMHGSTISYNNKTYQLASYLSY